MANRTAAHLALSVLRKLNVIPHHQEVEGGEDRIIIDQWQAIAAELMSDGIVEFDHDEIPLECFQACVEYVADRLAADYGHQPSRDPFDERMEHPALRKLRRRLSVEPAGDTIEIESF